MHGVTIIFACLISLAVVGCDDPSLHDRTHDDDSSSSIKVMALNQHDDDSSSAVQYAKIKPTDDDSSSGKKGQKLSGDDTSSADKKAFLRRGDDDSSSAEMIKIMPDKYSMPVATSVTDIDQNHLQKKIDPVKVVQ